MSTVLPNTREEQITFFENHTTAWTDFALQIGLSVSAVANLKQLTVLAREKLMAAGEAREASKSATQAFHDATGKMLEVGRDMITTVKAFAESTDNPNVYVLAQIPVPSGPTPAAAPTAPTDLTGSIDSVGRLTLSWKAQRSGPTSGIVFDVARKGPGQTTFTVITSVFEKSFMDTGFIACNGNASYTVTARRGVLMSATAGPLEINVGLGGGAMMTSTVFSTNAPPAKLAA
jgi:hypothetical protein